MSAGTHTGQLHAWLYPEHQLDGLFDGNPQQIVSALSYSPFGPGDACYQEKNGYTYVGPVSVTVSVGSRADIVAAKITGLKAKRERVLASAQLEATGIAREIQTLQAITMDEATA